MEKNRKLQQLFVGVAGLSLLLMSGCTTFATLPSEKISEGEKALTEAKESNASLNAPVEFKAAEDKLVEAKAAFGKKNYEEATRLAEQASVDADYARAKGTSEKAKKKAQELRQNIKTLRQEIELLSKQ
jgi:hypothetical protein